MSQEDNLGQEVLARMAESMTMDASQNYKYYMNQQFYELHNAYSQQRYQQPAYSAPSIGPHLSNH